jgi:hypothetical protein
LKKLFVFPWHVLLFAAFPVISLLANNTGQVNYAVAYRPLLLSVVVSAILLLAAKWVLHDWQKAGALVTVLNILFFSYGHVFSAFEDAQVAGILVGRHRVLGTLWLILLVLFFLWIIKSKDLRALTVSLNAITLFLLVFPVYTLVSFWYSNLNVRETELSKDPVLESLTTLQAAPDSPDVYFFILDQHARADVLAEYFNYDSSDFLNRLKELGFYVASCGQSNYPYTAASLAASLNFDYVPDLGDDFNPENKSFDAMHRAIKDSRVETLFRQMGYKIVTFETGYNFTELEDADIFYKLPSKTINSFEALLLRDSAMLIPSDFGLLDRFPLSDEARKREHVRFVLDELEEVPSIPGKKFVFVHLVIPHPPFVFGPNGESLVVQPYYENGEAGYRKEDFRRGYRNQVAFIDSQIAEALSKIIANSSRPPVIILQGDHGPIKIPGEKRMNILSAYFFPGAKPDFHPNLTSVNNFRLVFDTYFNADLPLLPDRSFYVDITQPYVFKEMKDPCVPSQ